MRAVYPVASYVTVNISSPNTRDLRQLQQGPELDQLLGALKAEQRKLAGAHGRRVPLAVKIAPDLDAGQITAIAGPLQRHGVEAVIATNTTTARDGVSGMPYAGEAGGVSGAPLTAHATRVVREISQALNGAIPVIAVGGVMSGADALEKMAAGASLVSSTPDSCIAALRWCASASRHSAARTNLSPLRTRRTSRKDNESNHESRTPTLSLPLGKGEGWEGVTNHGSMTPGYVSAPAVAVIDEQTCIGCTLCIQACPVDAIVGAEKLMHTVIAAECTGCKLCLPPCPVDCITMAETGEKWTHEERVKRARQYRRRHEARTSRLSASGEKSRRPGRRTATSAGSARR